MKAIHHQITNDANENSDNTVDQSDSSDNSNSGSNTDLNNGDDTNNSGTTIQAIRITENNQEIMIHQVIL